MTDSLLLDTLPGTDRVPFLIHTFDGECSIGIPVSSMFQILLDAFFRLRSVSIVPKSAKYFCSVMGFRFLALMLDSFSGFLRTSSLFRANKPSNQLRPWTAFSVSRSLLDDQLYKLAVFVKSQNPVLQHSGLWLQAVFSLRWEKPPFYQFCSQWLFCPTHDLPVLIS